ncbi:RNA polymerase sigma factor [Amycolatopsis sp. NPDC054798]
MTGADLHAACMKAAQGGDRRAMTKLVDELTPLVWHVARANGLDRQVAEDVVQTVWLALFSQLAKLRDPRALAAWLITTTRREATRPYGRRAQPVPLSDEVAATLESDHPAPEEEAVRADRDRRVWRAFLRLPARCSGDLVLDATVHARDEAQVVPRLAGESGSAVLRRGRRCQAH